MRPALLACLLSLPLALPAASAPPAEERPVPPEVVATFSIVAHDPDAKEWGVAVASKFLAVGSVVPWAQAGVGAVATQSAANTDYGPHGLELLRGGLDPAQAIER